MTQNVHIRFIGSADFGQAQKQIQAVTSEVAALSAAVQAVSTSGGMKNIPDVRFLDNFKKGMAAQRSVLQSSIMSLNDFGVKSVKVADHIETLTEKIRAQKFGVGDLIKQHKSLNDVYRQQMANRKAMVMEWSRNGDGSVNADVITRNRNAAEFGRNIKQWRSELGMYNQVLNSVADNTVKWGKNTQWAGRQMTAGLSMPLLAAAAGTGALAYQIDKGLTQIVKVYGDAATQFETTDAQIKAASMTTAKVLADTYGQSAKDSLEITAQLAATGKTGKELQESTLAVSRARLLGELDLQDAMKATTTLQSVYNMSSKELGDSFNYMNSMENQTVLTMQDFVVGIPKVSGVVKELGGDVKEVGVLLAAMKIAGIDAAEGANAIKSISFKTAAQTVGAKDLFQQLTGQSYQEVVGQTTDVTERLIKIGEAIKSAGVGEADRVGLIAKMFGLYQGSKALSIISQLTDGSEQMSRAIEVSEQSIEQWGETAERELSKLTGSNWNKFQQGWQTLKINLAEVGEVFLQMAIPVLDTLSGLVKGFNSLSDGTKTWIARLAVLGAAFGPIVMFAGLMGNMVGSIGKLSSFIVNLIAPFKMLTAEEEAATAISRLKKKTTNDEARAYAILTEQIINATAALRTFTDVQLQEMGLAVPPGTTAATAGKKKGKAKTAAVGAEASSAAIANNAGKTERSWGKISGHATTFGIMGAAGAAAMMTDTNSALGHVADIAFLAAGFGPMLMNLPFGKFGQKLKTTLSSAVSAGLAGLQFFDSTPRGGTKGPGVFSRMGTSIKAALAGVVPYITAVTAGFIAAAGAVYFMKSSVDHTAKSMEEFSGSAETYAQVLGFTFTEVGQKVNEAGEAIETLNQKAQKFAGANSGATEILKGYTGADRNTQMQMAVGEGLKAALHGATAEQAEEAAKIAWRIMDKTLSEEQMTAKIKAEIDFGNIDQVIDAKIRDIEFKLSQAESNRLGEGWAERVNRFINSDNGVNVAGQGQIKSQAKDMLDMLNNASAEALPGMIQTMKEAGQKADEAFFASTLTPQQQQALKDKGITTVQQFQAGIAEQAKRQGAGGPLGNDKSPMEALLGSDLNEGQEAAFQRHLETRRTLVEELAAADLTLNDAQRSQIHTIEDYLRVTGRAVVNEDKRAQGAKEWDEWQKRMAASGAKWSEQEKLNRLNILRIAAGLPKATSSAQGFADSIDQVADALTYLNNVKAQSVVQQAGEGFKSDMQYFDSAQIMEDLQSTYSSAMDTIYSGAAEASDRMMQAQMAGISSRFDNLRDNLDKQQRAANESFDRQVKRFDYAWEDKMDAWAKKWDKRKEATEAKYDSQIDKIRAQIKAEEDAEAIRQRIFEAEKTRMSRLAEMQNKNIDLNAALRTGKTDEAAKISNDMVATSTGWVLDDAAASGGTASDARKAKLEGKVDTLEKQKAAALKAMDDQEDRERKMLDRQKDRERELLDARRKAMEDTYALRKKNLDKQEANEKAATERSIARRKFELEAELSALKAFVPRDQKELDAHVKKIEEAYGRFGVDLTKSGKGWAQVVGNALSNSMETTRAKEANTTSWQALGRVVAENMSKGAFNMTLSQFIKWISTGEMPAGAGVGYKGKNARAVKDGKGGVVWRYGSTQGGIPSGAHSGGIIGKTPSSRTGFSGSTLSNSETLTNTLTGEAVLNRRAVRALGEDFINDINKAPTNTGIGGPTQADANISGALALAPMVVAFRNAIGVMGDKRQGQVNATASAGGGGNAYPEDMGALYPGGWRRPVGGPVTSRYGMRFHPTLHRWKLHGGTDFGVPTGTSVKSARGGKVSYSGYMGSYGNHIVVSHGQGLATTYSHLLRSNVKPGQTVSTGQTLGLSDSTGRSTGPHLHFEYVKNGKRLNPNLIIPGLDTGGFVMKDGLAKLHKEETVLTKPLSSKLDEGINKIADGPTIVNHNNYSFTGPINGIDDLERAIIEVNDKIEKRTGLNRKVGVRT